MFFALKAGVGRGAGPSGAPCPVKWSEFCQNWWAGVCGLRRTLEPAVTGLVPPGASAWLPPPPARRLCEQMQSCAHAPTAPQRGLRRRARPEVPRTSLLFPSHLTHVCQGCGDKGPQPRWLKRQKRVVSRCCPPRVGGQGVSRPVPPRPPPGRVDGRPLPAAHGIIPRGTSVSCLRLS